MLSTLDYLCTKFLFEQVNTYVFAWAIYHHDILDILVYASPEVLMVEPFEVL
jgi:hypothetical protein